MRSPTTVWPPWRPPLRRCGTTSRRKLCVLCANRSWGHAPQELRPFWRNTSIYLAWLLYHIKITKLDWKLNELQAKIFLPKLSRLPERLHALSFTGCYVTMLVGSGTSVTSSPLTPGRLDTGSSCALMVHTMRHVYGWMDTRCISAAAPKDRFYHSVCPPLHAGHETHWRADGVRGWDRAVVS